MIGSGNGNTSTPRRLALDGQPTDAEFFYDVCVLDPMDCLKCEQRSESENRTKFVEIACRYND